MTETNTPAGKRRTWRQAAIAGVTLTAIIGGLLAVDVANRPEQQVDCAVDLRDMGDDGDGTGGLANFGDPPSCGHDLDAGGLATRQGRLPCGTG